MTAVVRFMHLLASQPLPPISGSQASFGLILHRSVCLTFSGPSPRGLLAHLQEQGHDGNSRGSLSYPVAKMKCSPKRRKVSKGKIKVRGLPRELGESSCFDLLHTSRGELRS